LKFQAVAEKTAKDAMGLLYFAAPGTCTLYTRKQTKTTGNGLRRRRWTTGIFWFYWWFWDILREPWGEKVVQDREMAEVDYANKMSVAKLIW